MSVAPKSGSPYKASGGSLDFNHPTYVERQADKDLLDCLKRGEFCYVLNSRQMGKSSLRVQTMYRLRAEGIACAGIDLMGIDNYKTTPEQWYGGIVRELTSSLELKINSLTWWREHKDLAPGQRFGEFLEKVIFTEVSQNVVILVDEIDTALRLDFKDDFFAFIRACHEKHASSPVYKRLTFAFLGVATPGDLIRDTSRTPFNIGRAIELNGFQLHEAQPLTKGLELKVRNPQAVLEEVLVWTNGQPFLTQKLCHLLWTSPSPIASGDEAKEIGKLVQEYMIKNWEAHDEPEHLKTIRDHILRSEQHTIRLLGLYQEILRDGEIKIDASSEQMELRLLGLVVKQEGKLVVSNRIYKSVFNENWVDEALSNLRPYAEALDAWRDSNYQDKTQLLQGQQLENTLAWAAHKSLSYLDYQFLAASQELEKLEAERKAKEILTEARQKAKLRIRTGATILVMSLIGSIVAVGLAVDTSLRSQRSEIKALNSSSETLRSSNRLPEALIESVKAGRRQLRRTIAWVPDKLETETASILQQVIDTMQSRLEGHKGEVTGVSFSPDSQTIASASEDKTVKLWSWDGKESKEINTLEGHSERVWSVIFSPYHQNKTIATTSWDGTIKLWSWDGKKSKELATLMGHQGWVFSVSFSPNLKTIASVGADKMVRFWSWDGKESKLQKSWHSRHKKHVVAVAFSPKDSNIIVTASDDGTAKLWNQNGTLLRTLKGHVNEVNDVSFSPDGNIIVTTSDDGTAKLWNQSGTLLKTLEGHSERVMSVSFSADGQTIATTSFDKTVKLWKLDGTLLNTLQGHDDWVWDANFSPDGETLASASRDRTIRLWKINRNDDPPLKLDILLVRGCQLLHDYWKTKPNGQKIGHRLCDGIKN